MNQITLPVIGVKELEKIIIDHFSHSMKDWSIRDVAESILNSNFKKFNVEDLNSFLQSYAGHFYLPTLVVDFNDREFYWVVSGTNAILINKKNVLL